MTGFPGTILNLLLNLVLLIAAPFVSSEDCRLLEDQLQDYWPDAPDAHGLVIPHCRHRSNCQVCRADWADLLPVSDGVCGLRVQGCVASHAKQQQKPTQHRFDCLHGTVRIDETITVGPSSHLELHGPAIIDGQGRFQIFRILKRGILRLNNLVIRNGFSRSDGGGIYVESGGALHMDHVDLLDNRASGHGGGIFLAHPTAVRSLNLASMERNHAHLHGGGIYINDTSIDLVWTHGRHRDNRPAAVHGWWSNRLSGPGLPPWNQGFVPMDYINIEYMD